MKLIVLPVLLYGLSTTADCDTVSKLSLNAAEADARSLIASANGCSLNGIPSVQKLLSRYEGRPETTLRLLAVQARSSAGFTSWFRMHPRKARYWYNSVVRIYAGEEGIEFQRQVANANYMLALSTRSRRSKEIFLDRVLGRYASTNDLALLQTYARSLYAKSDLLVALGRDKDAEFVRQQAAALYLLRITPRLPTTDPESDNICI